MSGSQVCAVTAPRWCSDADSAGNNADKNDAGNEPRDVLGINAPLRTADNRKGRVRGKGRFGRQEKLQTSALFVLCPATTAARIAGSATGLLAECADMVIGGVGDGTDSEKARVSPGLRDFAEM